MHNGIQICPTRWQDGEDAIPKEGSSSAMFME